MPERDGSSRAMRESFCERERGQTGFSASLLNLEGELPSCRCLPVSGSLGELTQGESRGHGSESSEQAGVLAGQTEDQGTPTVWPRSKHLRSPVHGSQPETGKLRLQVSVKDV